MEKKEKKIYSIEDEIIKEIEVNESDVVDPDKPKTPKTKG